MLTPVAAIELDIAFIDAAVMLSGCKFDNVAVEKEALVVPPEVASVAVMKGIGVSELGFLKFCTIIVSLFCEDVTAMVIVTILELIVQVMIVMPVVYYI